MSAVAVLLELDLRAETDVFVARQRGREVAAGLGLEPQDQVRVAAAVSEVGRDVLAAGGGRVVLSAGAALVVEFTLVPPAGAVPPPAALPGAGTTAARRLVDDVDEVVRGTGGRGSGAGGAGAGALVVTLTKQLPARARWTPAEAGAVRERLRSAAPTTPLQELRAQNRELLDALGDASAARRELEQLNAELEQTNLGVVALYAELDARGEALREASEAKTRFLASVSHELRSPVNSVLGLSRLLLDPDAEPLSAEQRHQVEFVESSAKDLLALVNELLDLAKAESGRLEPLLGPVHLGDLRAELDGGLRPLLALGAQLLLAPPGPGVPEVVSSDPVLLRHVLRNLLSNAIKFTERGAVTLTTSLVGADGPGGRLRFEVTDTGIGIAEADLARVFEEFYQVRGPLQAHSKGTGLGLPYARRLVELLGGRLTARSEVGAGSTFTAELPLLTAQEGAVEEGAGAAAAADPPTAAEPAGGPEPHVGLAVVVDDDPAFRAVLTELLSGLADRVLQAGDGEQALALVRDQAPDVMFLDVRMPRLDGAGVLAALRAAPGPAPMAVVVVTAGLPEAAPTGTTGTAALDKHDLTRAGVARVLRRALGTAGGPA